MSQTAQQVPQVVAALEPIINRYGYLAVGGFLLLEDFGLPVPGETVLIAAAFYAGLGHLDIGTIIIVGILGAVIGDSIGFAIGTYAGRPFIERVGRYVFLTPARIRSAEGYFNRHGGKVVVGSRFISGLRQINGIIAGLSEMRWLRFVAFNILGAIIWVTFWALVGYFGGSSITMLLRYNIYLSVVVIVALLLFFGVRLLRKRRQTTMSATTKGPTV